MELRGESLNPATMKAPDFRTFLQNELTRRIRANPRFSLRGFAQILQVQSGFLSKILKGQRRVTPATVKRFGLRLNLSLPEMDAFVAQCSTPADQTEENFRQVAYDHFQVIADWYHFAILELISLPQFQTHPRWIAKSLGISAIEAKSAIDRLIRLGFIVVDPISGQWQAREKHSTTLGMQESAEALKRMQRQILEKAIQALDTFPIEQRDQSSMTMAIDSSRLPAAKLRLKKFRRSLCTFLESGSSIDSVYQLSISLFPLNHEVEPSTQESL